MDGGLRAGPTCGETVTCARRGRETAAFCWVVSSAMPPTGTGRGIGSALGTTRAEKAGNGYNALRSIRREGVRDLEREVFDVVAARLGADACANRQEAIGWATSPDQAPISPAWR